MTVFKLSDHGGVSSDMWLNLRYFLLIVTDVAVLINIP